MTETASSSTDNAPDLAALKARQKATWESGDFGQVARYSLPATAEFLDRLPLQSGHRLLDVACGTGNLALLATQRGCVTTGLDFAANLIAQARERAGTEAPGTEFIEGDAESLPFPDRSFDAVVTMFGAMFAPRPETVATELHRVTRPGGFVAMANWTPGGFIGRMFDIFQAHLPAPDAAAAPPSPLLWGDASSVRTRLRAFREVRCEPRTAVLRYPFPPAATITFFRRYYGPTGRAFDALSPAARDALYRDLVTLQAQHNRAGNPLTTETHAEYLEVVAWR